MGLFRQPQDVTQIGSQQLKGQSYQQPSISKKYAIIMVGRYAGLTLLSYGGNVTAFLKAINQSYVWFLNDAGEMYSTLHDVYGYDDDNIFLLVHLLPPITWKGKTYFNNIPASFNPSWIDYDSTEENLEYILSTFNPDGENGLDENDQLFICFIDHGANEGNHYAGNDHYVNEFVGPNNCIYTNYWTDENKAFDLYNVNVHYWYHDLGTSAVYKRCHKGWSTPLTLILNEPTTIKGFRISAKSYKDIFGRQVHIDQMKIKLYNGSILKNTTIFTKWADNSYVYKQFEEQEEITKVEISFNLIDGTFFIYRAKVYDFNIWTAEWDNCGEIGDRTFFGCPFTTIPDYLMNLWCTLFGYSSLNKLYDHELMSYTNEIQAKIIFALQPCMSGGFISELSGANRIICTASRGFELAEASWIGCFRNALKKYDEDQNGIPDADYNDDTKISILEAYRYAAEKVEYQLNTNPNFPPQHPLLDDNGPRDLGYWGMCFGVGHHLYETDYYDPNTPGKDGYLAANTYL